MPADLLHAKQVGIDDRTLQMICVQVPHTRDWASPAARGFRYQSGGGCGCARKICPPHPEFDTEQPGHHPRYRMYKRARHSNSELASWVGSPSRRDPADRLGYAAVEISRAMTGGSDAARRWTLTGGAHNPLAISVRH